MSDKRTPKPPHKAVFFPCYYSLERTNKHKQLCHNITSVPSNNKVPSVKLVWHGSVVKQSETKAWFDSTLWTPDRFTLEVEVCLYARERDHQSGDLICSVIVGTDSQTQIKRNCWDVAEPFQAKPPQVRLNHMISCSLCICRGANANANPNPVFLIYQVTHMLSTVWRHGSIIWFHQLLILCMKSSVTHFVFSVFQHFKDAIIILFTLTIDKNDYDWSERVHSHKHPTFNAFQLIFLVL